MKVVSKLFPISFILLSVFVFVAKVSAKQKYGFSSVSGNYLNWTEATEKRSEVSGLKRDFAYVELEGGSGYDWGTLYGFIGLENPGAHRENIDGRGSRVFNKGMMTVNLFNSNFLFYSHIYQIDTLDFQEQNRVFGFAYDWRTTNFWFQPFVGHHNVSSHVETPQSAVDQGIRYQGYTGPNGVMLGWVMQYNLNLAKNKFMVFWWHETEVGRNDAYGINGVHKSNVGQNGALSLWWDPSERYTLGLQYRYADHKLGTPAYQDGSILSLKFKL